MSDGNAMIGKILDALSESSKQIAALTENVRANQQATRDQEDRIRVLEGWQQRMAPVLAVGTFILGGVVMSVIRYAISN